MKYALGARHSRALVKLLAFAILGPLGLASAQNLVLNGDFEQDTQKYAGTAPGGSPPVGWLVEPAPGLSEALAVVFAYGTIGRLNTAVYIPPGTALGTEPNSLNLWGTPLNGGNGGNYPGTLASMESPTGDNFFAADSTTDLGARLSQTISGLVIGQAYQLSFDWAAGEIYPYSVDDPSGTYVSGWQVSFGGDSVGTMSDPIANHSFQAWKSETFSFIATSTSQVLSFLANGTPAGAPPMSLLDNVSLTQVPEPSVGVLGALCVTLTLGVRRRKA